MRRVDKAARISAQLEALYPDVPIPLVHSDSFTLLVAVVLSAQTTDKKVNEVTPTLFRRAPGPAEKSKLPWVSLAKLMMLLNGIYSPNGTKCCLS